MAIRNNAIITLSGQFINFAVFAALTPLYLHTVGYERYGLISVIWAITAYSSKFDLGIGSAITYYVSGSERHDHKHQAELLWTGAFFAVPLGLSAGMVLVAITVTGSHFFHLSQQVVSELLRSRLQIIAIGVSLILSSCATGFLLGRQRFLVIAVSDVLTQVLSIVLPVFAALALEPSIVVVVSATLCARLIGLMILFYASQAVLGHERPIASFNALKALTSYGSSISLANLIEQGITSADRFIIAAVAGAARLPSYAIPSSILTRAMIFPGSLMGAVFPRLVTDLSKGDERLIPLSLRVVLLLTPAFILGMLISEVLLRFWIGTSFSATATTPMRILIMAVWIETLSFALWYVILAQGRPAVNLKIAAVLLLPYISCLYVGVLSFGIVGAAIVYGLRNLAYIGARAYATRTAHVLAALAWRQCILLALTLILTLSPLGRSAAGVLCGLMLLAASTIEATRNRPPQIDETFFDVIKRVRMLRRSAHTSSGRRR